ncbi:MAG: hypothetical protein K9H16_02905 [Bacteroidales bacterium]|nr:hypothetical protein [Bacteroidales bacterium]
MIENSLSRNVEILLVEANPGDIRLAKEAFSEYRISNDLSLITDEVTTLKFINKEGEFSTSPLPNLMLMDMKLPKKNSPDVLEKIKTKPLLPILPEIFFSASKIIITFDTSYDNYTIATYPNPSASFNSRTFSESYKNIRVQL